MTTWLNAQRDLCPYDGIRITPAISAVREPRRPHIEYLRPSWLLYAPGMPPFDQDKNVAATRG